jgi:hypothetical protein
MLTCQGKAKLCLHVDASTRPVKLPGEPSPKRSLMHAERRPPCTRRGVSYACGEGVPNACREASPMHAEGRPTCMRRGVSHACGGASHETGGAHLASAPRLMLATISRMLMPPVARPSSAVRGLPLSRSLWSIAASHTEQQHGSKTEIPLQPRHTEQQHGSQTEISLQPSHTEQQHVHAQGILLQPGPTGAAAWQHILLQLGAAVSALMSQMRD